MKLKKMYFFIFIIGTALLSQSYGAGGAAAVRLLRQGLQNGIDAISRAGVSESTAKTLLDHYGNLSRAMGLPEGATIDDYYFGERDLIRLASTKVIRHGLRSGFLILYGKTVRTNYWPYRNRLLLQSL